MEGNEVEQVKPNRTQYIETDSDFSDEEEELFSQPSSSNKESKPTATQNQSQSNQAKVTDKPEDDSDSKYKEDIEEVLLRQSQSHNYKSTSASAVITKAPALIPVRHDHNDIRPGAHGAMESSALLVDLQKDGRLVYHKSGSKETTLPTEDFSLSDSEEDIPLSWQRSSRSMRDQLLKDGYNLNVESDNEDLDLIPPKSSYSSSGGGICSCSTDSCLIS